MKYRDLTNNPIRAIVDLDSSNGPEYTPDLDHGSIFRVDDTVNVTLNNPVNLKDGWYVRFEIATGASNTITFGDKYLIDATTIGGTITNSNGLYVLEGRYSADEDKLLLKSI